jgi:hypothetical protein
LRGQWSCTHCRRASTGRCSRACHAPTGNSAAYSRTGKRAERERQIRLIGEIGRGIAEFVRKPLLRTGLRMMRQPARMSGLSTVHDFLERGFVAFHKMGDATEFLATIDARERALMEELLAGETVPFPDPLEPRRMSAPRTES